MGRTRVFLRMHAAEFLAGVKVEVQNRAAGVLWQYVRRAAANHQRVRTHAALAVIAAAVLAELQVLRLLALIAAAPLTLPSDEC